MARYYYVKKNTPLYYRCIAVAKFICEDEGHSAQEAAEEFRVSETTIREDLIRLKCIAFCDSYFGNTKKQQMVLRFLYVNAKNMLKKVRSKNITSSKSGRKRRTNA